MIIDWVVVAYTANPIKEKGGAYPMLFSNGVIPDYKAIRKINMYYNEDTYNKEKCYAN